jgi:hypothetical protein
MEGGGIAMWQQEELALQMEELGQLAVSEGEGDQQDLVDIDIMDEYRDKEATEALLTT